MKRQTLLAILILLPLLHAGFDGAQHLLSARSARMLLELTPPEQSRSPSLEAASEQHYDSAISASVSFVALIGLAVLLFKAPRPSES